MSEQDERTVHRERVESALWVQFAAATLTGYIAHYGNGNLQGPTTLRASQYATAMLAEWRHRFGHTLDRPNR